MKTTAAISFPLNYTKNINDSGQRLTADFQYSYDNEDIITTIDDNQTFPANALLAKESVLENQKENEFLLQADYVLPLGDSQFEAGYRSNYERSANTFQLDTLNQNTGLFEINEELSNKFTYDENVDALYTQYGNKFGKFSFLLGLRLENTRLKGKVESDFDLTALEESLGEDVNLNFDKNYLGLFPQSTSFLSW